MKNLCLPKSLRNLVVATALALPITVLTAHSTLAQSGDFDFTLVNGASSTLREFYLVPNYAGNWGEDYLIEDLRSGESDSITVDDGLSTCIYDIYAVFVDGNDIEDYNVNLCALGTYTITDYTERGGIAR